MSRCAWAAREPSTRYHDEEWGVPVHDDARLFEALVLGGAQAGLSWSTILKRREGYRRAFRQFDPAAVARFGPREVERLLADPEIIRNRLKILSAIRNAQAFLAVQDEFGSFDAYLWGHVGGRAIVNAWSSLSEVPASSPESDALSADLKRRGFSFVGTTICYAVMQSVGLVNDHTTDCFRRAELIAQAGGATGPKGRTRRRP